MAKKVKETQEEQEVIDAVESDASSEELDVESASQSAGQDADQSTIVLQDALAAAEERAQEMGDKYLRLAAEFENYKKRMTRERESMLKYAEEDLLKELLPSIDNLERAVAQQHNGTEGTQLLEGVELTLKGLLASLEKFGLQKIDSVGQPFDPNFHEAMAMEASDEVPPQHVVKEYEKGYQYKDRLLRAAKVVVSSS